MLGRNITDLSSLALSVFKGVDSKRVSLLNQTDTARLVRLSEQNETLYWPEKVIDAVWALTRGHAYLTQALCSQVWEAAYDETPDSPPSVTPQMIEDAITPTLDASRHMLEWLWNGLGPAEKVVSAALAGAGQVVVDETRLNDILRESGIRILIRELQNAPELLVDWDILEAADGGHIFRVELLRRWLAKYHPISRTQTELDRILPAADSLFQAAEAFYGQGNLERAENLLEQAVGINPNHLRANEMLAEILIGSGRLDTAASERLEKLYEFAPANARPRLVQVYLAQAETASEDVARLKLYEKALGLDAGNPEARAGVERIRKLEQDTKEMAFNYTEGRQALQRGETQRAIEFLKKVVIHRPDYAYEKKSKGETAADLLAQAIREERRPSVSSQFYQSLVWAKSVLDKHIKKIQQLIFRYSSTNIDIFTRRSHVASSKETSIELLVDIFFHLELPLKNEVFIVRDMQKIYQNLKNGLSVFVTSGPRMGKTSTVKWINQQFLIEDQIQVISLYGIDTPEKLWSEIKKQTRFDPRSANLNINRLPKKKYIVLFDEIDNLLEYSTNHGKDVLQEFLRIWKNLRNHDFEFMVTSCYLSEYWSNKIEKIDVNLVSFWNEILGINIILSAWTLSDVKNYLSKITYEPISRLDEVANEIYKFTGGIPDIVRELFSILSEEIEYVDAEQPVKVTFAHIQSAINMLGESYVAYNFWNSTDRVKISLAIVSLINQRQFGQFISDELASVNERHFEEHIRFLRQLKLISMSETRPKIISQLISNNAMSFIKKNGVDISDSILDHVKGLSWKDAEFVQHCFDELGIRYTPLIMPKNELPITKFQMKLERAFGLALLALILLGLLYWIGLL